MKQLKNIAHMPSNKIKTKSIKIAYLKENKV